MHGRVSILGSSDLHMHLRSFDYCKDADQPKGGLARLASVIRTERAQRDARGDLVLLFDNGDSLQGDALDQAAREAAQSPHLFYHALGQIGYDAAGLGNHDFNFGLDYLAKSLSDAPIPMLCSNISVLKGRDLPLRRWHILRRDLGGRPIAIGVFSVVPPQTVIWDAHHLSGRAKVPDIVTCARSAVAALRAAGADLIVGLAHTGLGEDTAVNGQENALWPLAAIDGVDAIIAGHQHGLIPDPKAPEASALRRGMLHGTPVVMPGAMGAWLGAIELDLRWENAAWQLDGAHASLLPVDTPPDPEVQALTAPLHHQTRGRLAQPVGRSVVPLHSFFCFAAPSPSLALLAAAKKAAVQDLIGLSNGLPLLSAVAPAKLGGRAGPSNYVDIPAGALSLRHVHDLCFFPNTLRTFVVTGAQLREWLEMSAGIYSQILPGAPDQRLLNPARPAFNSDILYGVEYAIDLSVPAKYDLSGHCTSPASQRIKTLSYEGWAVQPEDRFAVVLSSYRANGGGNIHPLQDAETLAMPDLPVRDAVARFLTAGDLSQVDWTHAPRLIGAEGTQVELVTGPGAGAHLVDLAPRDAKALGQTEDGFLRLALTL